MAKLEKAEWVAGQIGRAGVTVIDPRRPMKYLAGHLPEAINLPVYKAFGADGGLLAPEALTEFIGGAGLGDAATPVLYDSPEGQNAAMLAWILEYLGRTDVHIMENLYEGWKAAGREVRYRPVVGAPTRFSARLNPAIRVTAEEATAASGMKFVDFRSREEFSGVRVIGEDTPGHIPGAVNLIWRDLANPPELILKPRGEIEELIARAGVMSSDRIVAYCRSGPRAALGYLALRAAGYDVRLFDGSWAKWTSMGFSVEC
ncbi:MAG TPA: rhodanese-like domain-containing protein [Candidatus Binataceae bacterium]|nr:rhodanese-like domain-containing protein [Candidatus Binataceae bacterium]